jgi:hypothetical protein
MEKILAELGVKLPGDGIARRRARAVFDNHPGRKDAREFDDAENQQEQERQG